MRCLQGRGLKLDREGCLLCQKNKGSESYIEETYYQMQEKLEKFYIKFSVDVQYGVAGDEMPSKQEGFMSRGRL